MNKDELKSILEQHESWIKSIGGKRADLQGADLRDANLDYSCLPLRCGSKKMKVDKRIASQIAAHFCALNCDDENYQEARTAILEFARMGHRADDLGLVEERER